MELAIKFTDQSESFTCGVELGRLIEKMERGDEVIVNNGFPVKESNSEVIKNACLFYGYVPIFSNENYNEWIGFMAVKKHAFN